MALSLIAPTFCQAGLGNDGTWMNGALPAAPPTPPSSSAGSSGGGGGGGGETFGYGHWYNPPATAAPASAPSGGGGYAAPVYYNAGPSPAQIAAQQAAQLAAQQEAQREAQKQQRMRNARSRNDQGLACSKRGDWASAAAYFQQALEECPGNATLRSNLSQAREQLAQQRREQERKVADAAAATDMKAAISQATNSMPVTNGDSQPTQASSSGLAFISGDTTRDSLGGRKSNPTLEDRTASDPNAAKMATNVKAIDQLTSIAENDKSLKGGTREDAMANAQLGFDTNVKQAGSVSEIHVDTPPHAMELPKLTKEEAGNSLIKEDVDNFNKWGPQLQQAKEELKKAQAAVDGAKDPGAKAVANSSLIAAQGKSDGLEIAVASTVADIADQKRKIHLDAFAVAGAVPAGQSPSATTVTGSAPAQ